LAAEILVFVCSCGLARRLSKQRTGSFANAAFLETMRLIGQIRFGAAAAVAATAASYHRRIRDSYLRRHLPAQSAQAGSAQASQTDSLSCVRLLANDRERFDREMRGLGMTAIFSSVSSKPDRQPLPVAQN
jgi:hypothetical protein